MSDLNLVQQECEARSGGGGDSGVLALISSRLTCPTGPSVSSCKFDFVKPGDILQRKNFPQPRRQTPRGSHNAAGAVLSAPTPPPPFLRCEGDSASERRCSDSTAESDGRTL